MSFYNNSEWKEFRLSILEGDNYTCVRCGRTKDDGAILQVHHTIYIKGKLPWQYATKDCETLCKGCHAEIHGLIIPKFGWEFLGMEDLGDLIGECEYCNNPLRYSFSIFHENWGYLNVGTGCCDNLTDSSLASNKIESFKRYINRRNNFIKSPKWISGEIYNFKKHALIEIKIRELENGFLLTINNLTNKNKLYTSLTEAKIKAFDVIESGELLKYCEKHKIHYPKKSKLPNNRTK